MRNSSTKMNYLALIIFVMSFVFWIGALFFGYLADDWRSPPSDERSFPAPTGY